ncbi:hypothetical protein C8J57DRAFT_1226064 [Mycena rebaudengoi]|nr:hypothetical protein C8J57DRAFT_1226064 [Mycena rebaudengoi]
MQMITVLPRCLDVNTPPLKRDCQERTDTSFDANHVQTADKACSQMFWVHVLGVSCASQASEAWASEGVGVERDSVGKHLGMMDKIEIWARKSQVKALIARGPLAASKWPTERVRQPRQLNTVMWLSSSDEVIANLAELTNF